MMGNKDSLEGVIWVMSRSPGKIYYEKLDPKKTKKKQKKTEYDYMIMPENLNKI